MSLNRLERTRRMSAYAALAGGVIPAVAASGAIVSQTGLTLMATPGSPLAVDFGGAFGAVFQFSVATSAFYGGSSFDTSYDGFYNLSSSTFFQTQVVNFNPGNTGGWSTGQLVNYGSAFIPTRLGAGVPLNAVTSWATMSSTGAEHPLAFRSYSNFLQSWRYSTSTGSGPNPTSSFFTSFGASASTFDWAPNERGFLGVRFSQNGTDFHYAWFDVEADLDNFKLTIHGWGFEDVINRPIETGQVVPAPAPVGLALLAMGAAGIRRHRRNAA